MIAQHISALSIGTRPDQLLRRSRLGAIASVFALLLPMMSEAACEPASGPADVCYLSTGDLDNSWFYELDLMTGETTQIGNIPGLAGFPALAINSAGVIYGMPSTGDSLCIIDSVTGCTTCIPSPGNQVTALEFDQSDVLYGVTVNNRLITIFPSGSRSTIGFTTTSILTGIDFDPITDVLYGVSGTSLYTINRASGFATLVGSTSFDELSDLASNSFGTLYAVSEGDERELITIDKVTGGGAFVAPIGRWDGVGLALLPLIGPPRINSIADVPNDQGRQVSLIWTRSALDGAGGSPTITEYGIWRRIDAMANPPEGALHSPPSPTNRQLRAQGGDVWHFVSTVPARGDDTYATVVPTLCDSTDAGACFSTFFVSAMTADPLTFFDSSPDSGYSVDNLAPEVPANIDFNVEWPTLVEWDDAPEQDFSFHTVYGSDNPEFDLTATPLGYTVAPNFDVAGSRYDYFHVTTSDYSGNESRAATIGNEVSSAPDGSGTVKKFAFRRMGPSPFGQSAVFEFDLPSTGQVHLVIFDASGRKIRELVNGSRAAGSHAITWDGTGVGGQATRSGVYFAKIRMGSFAETLRLVRLQ